MASRLAGPAPGLASRHDGEDAPGPALPDGPHLPRIIQAWLWLKQPTQFLDHCARTYGDIFTIRLPLGMDMVHFTSPDLVRAVFGGDNDVLRAGEANAMVLEPVVGKHSVLVLDGPEHLRQRKLILPAFHGDRMRAWEDTVREITRAEVARWPIGKAFALRPAMQSITLDVVMQVIFGVHGSPRAGDLRAAVVAVTRSGANPFMLFVTQDRRLGPRSPWARFVRARDRLDALLAAEIRERRDASDLHERGDVASQLLLARDDEGRAMTDQEVRDELVTLLFAGHETTATSLAWAFDLLLHNPPALAKLAEEADSGGSEYLDATIKEVMRLRPVVAIVVRHVRAETWVGGVAVPAGSAVCPNIYLAQRRADLYEDPAEFRPERFAGSAPPAFGWFPFGGGIRRCIGATFATFEMRIVLPEVLQALTLRPASRREATVRREAVTFVPHDGARCVVTARRPAATAAAGPATPAAGPATAAAGPSTAAAASPPAPGSGI